MNISILHMFFFTCFLSLKMHYLDHLLECPIGPSLKVLQLRRLFDWTIMAGALPQFFGAARHPCIEVSGYTMPAAVTRPPTCCQSPRSRFLWLNHGLARQNYSFAAHSTVLRLNHGLAWLNHGLVRQNYSFAAHSRVLRLNHGLASRGKTIVSLPNLGFCG